MIRDRLVVGLRDAKLSEKFQLDATLTLDKAVTQVRQAEAVKKQQTVLRSEEESLQVGRVQKGKPEKSKKPKSPPITKTKSCGWCGKSPVHDRSRCPAKEAICRKCNTKGHFGRVCRSSAKIDTIHRRDNSSDECDDAFLGTVGESTWKVSVQVNGHKESFTIDTGAEVTVIPERVYKALGCPKLSKSGLVLKGPGQHELQVQGMTRAVLTLSNRQTEQELYVVKDLQRPLLGQPAIEALQLLSRVRSVQKSTQPEVLFPKLFKGLGKLLGEYRIKLREGAKPFALSTPRRVAIPLLPAVKKELNQMEQLGVISRVEEPTEWCAGMVVVPKSQGRVRICVDLTKLNANVLRERHILPAVEQTLAQVFGARYFSKLDATSGFRQIPLAKESSLLTTFITPVGRYRFNRLPFGITSAPEHFQSRMMKLLNGIEGVVCLMDDVLIHGKTQEEHDERLHTVLRKLEQSGMTLNKDKCTFSSTKVKFLGQILSDKGISSDPEKVAAILQIPEPTNVPELRRFLGMVNHLAKFTPNLAEMTKPLRELLSKKNDWCWEFPQKESFAQVKKALTQSPVLALFDPRGEIVVSADASFVWAWSSPLTATTRWKSPSRSMSATEQTYAQIEKEALAITWACERFSDYLIGTQLHIETDHKPLVPLLSTKLLDELPLRVQRFRMRLMRFNFSISHTPGKDLVTADALSRAPYSSGSVSENHFEEQVECYIQQVLESLPATKGRLDEIKTAQREDEVCQRLVEFCQFGWPRRVYGELKKYAAAAPELSVEDGLLMRAGRIVIPSALQKETLDKLHTGHRGIRKCHRRAVQSVWWPGLSTQLEQIVRDCSECIKYQSQRAEPLKSTPLPKRPWQKVGTDLFDWNKSTYLLIVDYYSRWIEISLLQSLTSESVIHHTKSIFARHGIPDEVISDNGPQYASQQYSSFAKEYGFVHKTSSPYHPQGNGEAERAVKTIKGHLKKDGDPYLALLAYRSTPLEIGYSPSEFIMGRKLKTTVPIAESQLTPRTPNLERVKLSDDQVKRRQKSNYDSHHGTKSLPV